MPDCDALFLDFYGVLVESEPIKTRAFVELYKGYGPDAVNRVVAHHLAHGGVSRRRKIRHCHETLLGVALTNNALDELAERFSRLVEDAVVVADWVPGAERFLKAHCGRRPMFVISGTPDDELRRIIARRWMNGCFVSVHGSPPEKETIIRALLAAHRLDPSRVIFIGDAMTDWNAAKAMGLMFVGRAPPDGLCPFPEGTTVVPDLTRLTF